MTGKAISAIVGVGVSRLDRRYEGPADIYAAEAIDLAIADAGLERGQIDGLLINKSPVAKDNELTLTLQNRMGYRRMGLMAEIAAEGSSAVQMVQYAGMAIQAGLATRVVCVFADTPLKPSGSGSGAFDMALQLLDFDGWEAASGLYGPVGAYALFASYHMGRYGITEDQLAWVALSDRQWAMRNPAAKLTKPLTLDDYRTSPLIASPFRVLDCAYPVNGAAAVVVTAADQVAVGAKAAYVHGIGQGHSIRPMGFANNGDDISGAALAARGAYAMAGIGPQDIDTCQFYEAFSYSTLFSLEEYGLCKHGESGALVAGGALAPGGRLPTNTGGGHLSGYYLQGMTPLVEGVVQARGTAGERQVKSDLTLVTGIGGCLQHHAALILSPHRSL